MDGYFLFNNEGLSSQWRSIFFSDLSKSGMWSSANDVNIDSLRQAMKILFFSIQLQPTKCHLQKKLPIFSPQASFVGELL